MVYAQMMHVCRKHFRHAFKQYGTKKFSFAFLRNSIRICSFRHILCLKKFR